MLGTTIDAWHFERGDLTTSCEDDPEKSLCKLLKLAYDMKVSRHGDAFGVRVDSVHGDSVWMTGCVAATEMAAVIALADRLAGET